MNAIIVLALYFAPPAPLELPELLEQVATHAPSVRVRDAQVDLARRRAEVAGAWEDPTRSIMSESIPLPGGPQAALVMGGGRRRHHRAPPSDVALDDDSTTILSSGRNG